MAIFLTGSTGYIGAHIAAILLQRHADRLNLLVRAKTEREANERLWHALQLHMEFPEFRDALETRISVFRGDLTDTRFGLDAAEYSRLVGSTESVIHCAASLNRKSEKSCLNVNLRGTLERVERLKADVPAGMSLPDLALRFILENPAVTTTIPGMRRVRNVEANLAVSDARRLAPPLVELLRRHRWDRTTVIP